MSNRDIIWRFFFPSSYQVTKPSEPVTVGQRRVAKKFVFELKTSANINLDLYFMRHDVVEVSFVILLNIYLALIYVILFVVQQFLDK